MCDNIPESAWLARFVHQSKDIKKSSTDQTVCAKWTAFYDARPGDLSVDMHKVQGADIDWQVGYDIKCERGAKNYYGAADIPVFKVRQLKLDVVARPVRCPRRHPNHAEITGMSNAKEIRMQRAKDLSLASVFYPLPSSFRPRTQGFFSFCLAHVCRALSSVVRRIMKHLSPFSIVNMCISRVAGDSRLTRLYSAERRQSESTAIFAPFAL